MMACTLRRVMFTPRSIRLARVLHHRLPHAQLAPEITQRNWLAVKHEPWNQVGKLCFSGDKHLNTYLKMSPHPLPKSCDTFVVLPDRSKGGHVVFGKNSDRPQEEVQEIVYRQSQNHEGGSKLQCTYIEIDQVEQTHAVILSKPSWMWGAEMGANEHGVCVGNEAVWTKLHDDEDNTERLLGMDLVRLSLERSSTAEMAVDVITSLLEKYGQGGPCSDTQPDLVYHNSFLIADHQEAWILETAGSHWAAEQVKSGYRNISNDLSIGTKIDKMSEGLKEFAQEKGWWDGSGEFNFTEAYGTGGDSSGGRKECGEKLLARLSEGGNFDLKSMFTVLRDERSGICMSHGMFVSTSSQVVPCSIALTPLNKTEYCTGDFSLTQMFEVLRNKESGICRGTDHDRPTAGSMVSVISHGSGRPSCHWFTGTPDPQRSVFKPFIFTNNVKISPHIQSPKIAPEEDPAKVVPRFAKTVNRTHLLYRRQQAATENGGSIVETLRDLERKCVQETEAVLENFDPERLSEMDDLFKDCVDSELKFYK